MARVKPSSLIMELGSSVFSPTSISGLTAWVDFSDRSTLFQDTARTSPVTTDGQSIKGVTNKAGSVHLSEGSVPPSYKVNIQAGLSVARFVGGSSQKLDWASNPSSGKTAGTVFVVHHALDNSSYANSSPISEWGTAATADHVPYSDGQIYEGWGSTARRDCGNPSVNLNNKHIYVVVTAASDYRTYIAGGTPFFSSGTNTVGWAATAKMMYSTRTPAQSDGDICEVIVYDSALSLTNLNAVANALAAKWNVSWTTAT